MSPGSYHANYDTRCIFIAVSLADILCDLLNYSPVVALLTGVMDF